MTKKTYTFHTDPGHGWLEVPMSDISFLDIWDKISSCSYVKGLRVFLEEDCDAPLFLTAAQNKGWETKINSPASFNEEHWIRECEPWRII